MSTFTENDEQIFTAYVRVNRLSCPLERSEGVIRNGNFVADYYSDNPDEVYPAGDYFINPGFLVVNISDSYERIDTTTVEEDLHNAIEKSLQAYFHDCLGLPRKAFAIRTKYELNALIQQFRHGISHVIITGHGNTEGWKFFDGVCCGSDISEVFEQCSENPVQVISFCCHSGCEEVAKTLSESIGVSSVIAPDSAFSTVYGVHWLAGYLIEYFLKAKSTKEAVKSAIMYRENTPMMIWKNGTPIDPFS